MGIGTRLFRGIILGTANNRAVRSLSSKYGMKLGASRFVAGESGDEALAKAQALNAMGIAVTMDHLGEGIADLAEADAYLREYLTMLDAMNARSINGNISLKPTQMGLALDPTSCYERIREIVSAASSKGNRFVRLDMEDSPYTEATIQLVYRLHREEGLTNVGTVIQAYLYRSSRDVYQLSCDGMNLRLVKGAYKEPASIAFASKDAVDINFKKLIKARLDSRVYTAIATHDERIIEWTKSYAKRRGYGQSGYEFQMLYGIRMPLQQRLAKEGYTVRSYVPYGKMWYPYFVRRIAERPANLGFVVRNLLKKG
ncbi:proline dehydrogenase family protein [Paenibacillus sp. GCM10023252]|uniref:proline dehydrogenase family protein n=1 Tax=Paenibacillus sp. GCM10023252 TaxID=3252649 RepID=UPI0036074BDE